MTEQAKVPAIRFAGFTDPWEQRKLGDVADLLTGYPFESRHFTDTGIPLVRGMNVKRGYLDMSADICENWSDAVGVEDYLLKAGDIVIQMDGALIGSSYAMVTPENTPSLLVQRVTRVRCGNRSRYIFQAVQRGFLRYIKSLKTETAVPHLSLSDIADYAIPVPKEEREQEHIGSFFSRLDDLITLHQRKYDKLVIFKKSMLEKMFPKDGESVPEIRFAGFTDPWEQRKLGELYEKNDERNTFGLGAERTLSIATMTFNSEGNGADASSLPNYKVIRVGDVAFEGHSNKSFAYGRFVVNAVADGIMSPRFSCLRPKNSYPVRFWKYYIHSEQVMREILVRATKSGTMMNELVIDDLFKQSIAVPQEAEQQAIGYFFSHLDTLITLHQRKLELLQNIKKSLLDKMFV